MQSEQRPETRELEGTVTPQERDELQALSERRQALLELATRFADSGQLHAAEFQKLVVELGTVSLRINEWWTEKSAKYHWKDKPDHHREVNFQDCSVYLVNRP